MEIPYKTLITVTSVINAPLKKVWQMWTNPVHIINWNNASADWHTPRAENDLKPGGRFISRMEAKDGSMGFDFGGTYEEVKENVYIAYTLDDGRKVTIHFSVTEHGTEIVEQFEPENTNSLELQQGGWQVILDNFKKYAQAKHLS